MNGTLHAMALTVDFDRRETASEFLVDITAVDEIDSALIRKTSADGVSVTITLKATTSVGKAIAIASIIHAKSTGTLYDIYTGELLDTMKWFNV